ncbi:MAG: hypothetical protein KJ600_01610 [Nanoarchaeota archaeon]|nr:hypothetical protein [Nanoarchaeota archaeon]MBU1103236.1 hypothetical protein [Nanoarchaeota archaeon]
MPEIQDIATQIREGDRLEIILNERACYDSGLHDKPMSFPRIYACSEQGVGRGKLDGKKVLGYVFGGHLPAAQEVTLGPMVQDNGRPSLAPLGCWIVKFDAVKEAEILK